MIHFEVDKFPNLSLSPYKRKEGLIKWVTPTQPYIDYFNDIIPDQPSFFISKNSWMNLCNGSGWLPNDSEVYALLFCIAYDGLKKTFYYRIRTMTVTKIDLANSLNPPHNPIIKTWVYSSPVAFTRANDTGLDCMEWLGDSDSVKRKNLNTDVDIWKSTVRTHYPQFLPLPPNELYIGDIVGKKRILDIFEEFPNVEGITLCPALYKEKNTPFIVFKVNHDFATIGPNGLEPLKCPPGSINPCQNNES